MASGQEAFAAGRGSALVLWPLAGAVALFDEALQELSGLKADEVVAPAELLFYQGVVYHHLLVLESPKNGRPIGR